MLYRLEDYRETAAYIKAQIASLLSNMAAGILDAPLSDDKVVSVGERSANNFARLLKEILSKAAGV